MLMKNRLVSFAIFLLPAIACGSLFERNKNMLFQGKGINEPNKQGITPFMDLFYTRHGAMPKGKEKEFISYLIKEQGAEINKGDNQGRTALSYALTTDVTVGFCAYLIEYGADLKTNDQGRRLYLLDELFEFMENYFAPIYWDKEKQFERYKHPISLLLSKGCRLQKERHFRFAVIIALEFKFYDSLRQLLEEYIDINKFYPDYYRCSLNWCFGKYRNTALSNMIQQTIQKRAGQWNEFWSKIDSHSYFSLLPRELVQLTNDYSDTQKMLREIALRSAYRNDA